MRTRIKPGQIKIGIALPWDVYNGEGRRIFRKGFIFHSKESLQRVSGLELYYAPAAGAAPPAVSTAAMAVAATDPEAEARRREVMYEFAQSQAHIDELIRGNIFRFIDYSIAVIGDLNERITGGETGQFEKLDALIHNLIRGYNMAPDAFLGAMHLEYEHPLSNLQPVYTVFGCLSMAEALNLAQEKVYSLVGAALTANLGMYRYFDLLVNRSTPLDEEEIAFLHTHPELSHKLLRENAVSDELWLNIVLQHHERGDGKGYPRGLKREDILLEASILAAVDTYIAMVTPRAYRKPLMPKIAMQTMYKTAVATDDLISIGLIKQLGIYPPGSLVRLANQEIAVVLERNRQHPVAPRVAAIGQLQGRYYPQVIKRDTDSPAYKILDAFQPESPIEIDLNQLWRGEIGIGFDAQHGVR